MHPLASIALAALALMSLAAPPPAPPGAIEDAADRVAAALAGGDAAGVAAVAADPALDPWLVADELFGRGNPAAAEALAAACKSPDTTTLASFLRDRKPAPTDAADREALRAGAKHILEKRPAEALAALEKIVRPTPDFLSARADYGRGLALRATGRVVEGAEAYRQCSRTAESLGWLHRASQAAIQSAETFVAARRMDDAFGLCEDLLRVERARGRKAGEAEAIRRTGILHLMTGNLAAGAECLDRALPLARESNDTMILGRCLANRGTAHLMTGDLARGTEFLQQSVEPLEKSGDHVTLEAALANLANGRMQRGEYERALEIQEKAILLSTSLGNFKQVADLHLQAAQSLKGLGRYDEAQERLAKASAIARDSGDPLMQARLLVTEGNAHFEKGDFARALRCQEQAYEIHKKHGAPQNLALSISLIGNVYTVTGDYKNAVIWQKRALEIQRQIGDRISAAVTLGNLGASYLALEQYDEAVPCLEEAIRLKKELGDGVGAAMSQSNLGDALRKRGRAKEAIEAHLESIRAFEAHGDRHSAARGYGDLGDLHTDAGEFDAAVECFDRALAIAEEIGARESVYFSRSGKARALLARGEAPKAIALCLAALEDLAVLVAGFGDEHGALAREQYQGAFDIGIMASVQAGDAGALWTFLESERAGALLESLGNRVALAAATIPEDLLTAAVAARAREADARLGLEKALAEKQLAAVGAARKSLDEARRDHKAAVERIQREAKAAADVLYPRAIPLDEGRAQLRGPEEALVLFSGTSQDALALVVESSGARIVPLGARAPIEAACAELSLQGASSDPSAALERLRGMLVAPLRLPDTVRRVLVSPWGTIAFVPMAALLPGRDVAYVPSGTTLRALRDSGGGGTGVLGLGDPDYGAGASEGTARRGPSFTPLPASRAEASAVATTVLLGKEASETALRTRLAGAEKWRAIHLACHGLVNLEDPSRSTLALAQDASHDGLLSVLEVFGLNTRTDLVVLSACDTARGKVFRTEGILGFPRAFMLAGAPRVIVSLWKVDDEATRALMEAFYRHWNPRQGTGLSAAESLRRAQEEVRGQERWKHPAYWAAWQLWGRGD